MVLYTADGQYAMGVFATRHPNSNHRLEDSTQLGGRLYPGSFQTALATLYPIWSWRHVPAGSVLPIQATFAVGTLDTVKKTMRALVNFHRAAYKTPLVDGNYDVVPADCLVRGQVNDRVNPSQTTAVRIYAYREDQRLTGAPQWTQIAPVNAGGAFSAYLPKAQLAGPATYTLEVVPLDPSGAETAELPQRMLSGSPVSFRCTTVNGNASRVDLYRYFSPATGAHLSMSAASPPVQPGYTYEGFVGYLATNAAYDGTPGPNQTVPVYNCYSNRISGNYLTTSRTAFGANCAEGGGAEPFQGDSLYRNVGYIWTSSAGAHTLPIYRCSYAFQNPAGSNDWYLRDSFLTRDSGECTRAGYAAAVLGYVEP
jgi:hypothetical protein